jgi:methanogenic corrinoid protein MtbC1
MLISLYAGIILGPVPHMVSDLGGHTSLVELLKEPGYPHTFVAVQGGAKVKQTTS